MSASKVLATAIALAFAIAAFLIGALLANVPGPVNTTSISLNIVCALLAIAFAIIGK